jgi:hypothetical protein
MTCTVVVLLDITIRGGALLNPITIRWIGYGSLGMGEVGGSYIRGRNCEKVGEKGDCGRVGRHDILDTIKLATARCNRGLPRLDNTKSSTTLLPRHPVTRAAFLLWLETARTNTSIG